LIAWAQQLALARPSSEDADQAPAFRVRLWADMDTSCNINAATSVEQLQGMDVCSGDFITSLVLMLFLGQLRAPSL